MECYFINAIPRSTMPVYLRLKPFVLHVMVKTVCINQTLPKGSRTFMQWWINIIKIMSRPMDYKWWNYDRNMTWAVCRPRGNQYQPYNPSTPGQVEAQFEYISQSASFNTFIPLASASPLKHGFAIARMKTMTQIFLWKQRGTFIAIAGR